MKDIPKEYTKSHEGKAQVSICWKRKGPLTYTVLRLQIDDFQLDTDCVACEHNPITRTTGTSAHELNVVRFRHTNDPDQRRST